MSFGVAFAFPAYDNPPNVGPFTQSGPTLDLLFTGLPAVNNTFVGQSLDLNFLTQQYQLPAQYSVWVAGQGLTAKTFSDLITFTRNSTATYSDSTGTLQTASINVPRFDYNPSTLASLGLLVEEARTNLALQSENFSVSSIWSTANVTVTADSATAPDGAVTADLLTAVAAGSVIVTQLFAKAALSVIYSSSVWVKVAAGSISAFNFTLDDGAANNRGRAVFNLSTGATTTVVSEGTFTNTTATITPYINSWYRLSITTTSSTATTLRIRAFYTATGAGVENVYLWGAQLEADASFSTSYIGPTTASSVPREADLAAINTLSPWFNSSQGTLFAQFEASANTYTAYVDISNGVTAQNSIHIDNDTGLMRAVYYSGSAPVATLSLGAIGTVGTVNKVATSYAANDFKANRNGGSVVSDPAGAVPVGLTQMNIGADPSGTAANVINGHIQRITYYPRSMANYELQALTV